MAISMSLYRLLAVSWMGLIFYLSAQPSLPVPMLFLWQDKAAHFTTYAVLGWFYARSLGPLRGRAGTRVILVALLAVTYGISDEFHQSFVPGRDASGWDVLADGLGGLFAAWISFWWDGKASRARCAIFPLSKDTGSKKS